jgi:hypothetical protein
MSDAPVQVVSPPELLSAQTLVCANCGAPLEGEYCTRCGQRHEPHVHSLTHFAGEAFESITHADSRLWRTLWFLLSKPGILTREFFAGRRVSYLPPFRLYLVISLLFFLVANLPEKFGAHGKPDAGEKPTAERIQGMNDAAKALETELATTPAAAVAASHIRAEAAREKAALEAGGGPIQTDGLQEKNAFTEFCASFAKTDPTANANYAQLHDVCLKTAEDHGKALWEAIVHNIPRAMFVFLPLLALAMMLIYWRPRRYYVEHLLFLVHNHGFVFLALAIVGLLDRIPGLNGHLGLLKFAVGIYIVWYIFRAMRNYYQQSRVLTFAKYLTIGLAYIVTTITVFVLTAVYSALTL